jgi:hypothetical protein
MGFKKAEKYKSKLRAALFGASGSGKTFSALAIASGIAERINTKIAVIDSEHGSAQKYADIFVFDIVELENKTIDEYIANIGEAGKAGYGVLIIDSTSHAWQELLEEVDKIGKTKFKGNSWAAWQEGTPKQKKFIDAILSFDGHIIVTMRSKTEWQTTDSDGKKSIKRLGLAPEQGKGIEYEFDLLLEINTDHMAEVIKDRTGKFQDKIIEKPGAKFGQELIDWLNTGADIKPKPVTITPTEMIREAFAGTVEVTGVPETGTMTQTEQHETTPREKLIMALQYYTDNQLIPQRDKWPEFVANWISWFTKNKETVDKYQERFEKTITALKTIEKDIPISARLSHGLYKDEPVQEEIF